MDDQLRAGQQPAARQVSRRRQVGAISRIPGQHLLLGLLLLLLLLLQVLLLGLLWALALLGGLEHAREPLLFEEPGCVAGGCSQAQARWEGVQRFSQARRHPGYTTSKQLSCAQCLCIV